MTTKTASEALIASRPHLKDSVHVGNRDVLRPPPPQYTPGLRDQICDKIKAGQRPHVAAAMAGLNKTTFDRWMKAGRNGDPHLWEFFEAVEQALAIFEGKMVDEVIAPNDGRVDASNAKFMLERRFADGYSKEVDAKVRAYMEEIYLKLQSNLDFEITDDMVGKNLYQLVLDAANGERYVPPRKMFGLNDGEPEEDSSAEEDQESPGGDVPEGEDGDEDAEGGEA